MTQRNMGSTQRLFAVLEKNRGKLFTAGQLADLAGVAAESVGKLLNQVKSRTPDLRLESPSRGLWVYLGWADEAPSEVPTSVTTDAAVGVDGRRLVTADVTTTPPARPRRRVTAPSVTVGDVCEVIGLSQDATPIVRDGNGKLYLLQQL